MIVAAPISLRSPSSVCSASAAVKKVASIATLPEITARIISTVEDPRSSAAQLHKIVSHDPALVTRILKVVNSAFYGLPGQVGSVERGIVLLGLNAIKNIAIAASLGQLFRGVKLSDTFGARDLWTHCVGVGITARELARQMKLPLADEAFLAGMIHDVGLLVSMQLYPDKLQHVCKLAETDERPFCEIEREVIGLDHQELGQALAESWKFPRSCQLVAGQHHHPAQLDDGSRLLTTLVYVADTICARNAIGFNLTAMRQNLHDAEMQEVHIDPALVERTEAGLAELVSASSSVFC